MIIIERKISWNSGCYDEIQLVYDKADENEILASIMSELEAMSLCEAEDNCGLLNIGGKPITREMFHDMSEHDKEVVIYYLSDVGLQEFAASNGKITVTFTPHIQRVLGCTMFSLLNRLEKIDGSFNVLFPNATLELRIPFGAKKGMAKYETLIVLLYPWLSIMEMSANTVSSTLNVQSQAEEPVTTSARSSKPSKVGIAKAKKEGFFAKLFGKK